MLFSWALMTGCPSTTTDPPVTNNFDGIIQTISLNTDAVCIGEQVEVTVTAVDPVDANQRVQVFVDGWFSDYQHVQYMAPGDRRIRVYAITRDGEVDRQEVGVTVLEKDDDACRDHRYVQMFSARSPYGAEKVDFWLEGWDLGTGEVGFTGDFTWDFGDGTSVTTDVPYVSHDYGPSTYRTEEYTPFAVTVEGLIGDTSSGAGVPFLHERTLSVASGWHIARQGGWVPLEIVTSEAPERPDGSVSVEFVARNYHEQAVTLDEYYVQYNHCDLSPPRWEAVSALSIFGNEVLAELGSEWPYNTEKAPPENPGLLTIGAGVLYKDIEPMRELPTEKPGKLEMLPEHVSSNVCSLGVHLKGTTDDGLTARGSFYHTVRLNRQQRQTVTNPTTIATLEALVEDGVVPDDDIIRTEELYTLEQQRVVNRTQDGWEVNP